MKKTIVSVVLALGSLTPWALARNVGAPGNTPTPDVPAMLVIQVPEPSSLALLAIDLLSVGGVIVFLRRRASGTK
jgi:hypothetical protein